MKQHEHRSIAFLISVNESSIQLSKNLSISYASYGDPDGKPAFYFHGLPGSRYEGEFLHRACQEYEINLIAPDRFGYGQSSPLHGNRYLNWADGVRELADKLGFGGFYIFAHSGGAPYALGCASLLKKRVIATGICGGLGSLVHPELRAPMQTFARLAILLAGYSPRLLSMSYGFGATLAARYFSGKTIDLLGVINGEPDKSTMAYPEIRSLLIRNFQCAFTQKARGAIDDLIAANVAWPFELTEIKRLYLWAGDRDRVVPASHSQWIKQQVPHALLEIVANQGHFSLPFNYTDQIVSTVVSTDNYRQEDSA